MRQFVKRQKRTKAENRERAGVCFPVSDLIYPFALSSEHIKLGLDYGLEAARVIAGLHSCQAEFDIEAMSLWPKSQAPHELALIFTEIGPIKQAGQLHERSDLRFVKIITCLGKPGVLGWKLWEDQAAIVVGVISLKGQTIPMPQRLIVE